MQQICLKRSAALSIFTLDYFATILLVSIFFLQIKVKWIKFSKTVFFFCLFISENNFPAKYCVNSWVSRARANDVWSGARWPDMTWVTRPVPRTYKECGTRQMSTAVEFCSWTKLNHVVEMILWIAFLILLYFEGDKPAEELNCQDVWTKRIPVY